MLDFSNLKPGDRIKVTTEFVVEDTFERYYGLRLDTTSGHSFYAEDFGDNATMEIIND